MIRWIIPTSTANRPKRRSRKKIGDGRRYTLKPLIRAITEENRHRENRLGQPVGNEIW